MTTIRKIRGTKDCAGKSCPAVHEAENGDYVIQGYLVTDPNILGQLDLPAGESAVRVPRSLLESL
jgi:hypothetical protein